MARLKLALLALAILPAFVSGQQTPLNHTVVRGETLWALAERYYQDPFLWPRIWEANRALVADPDLILPDWVLQIPGIAGPAIVSDVTVRQQEPSPAPPEPAEPGVDPRTRNRTVFFRDPDTGGGVTGTAQRRVEVVPRHAVYSSEWLVEGGGNPDRIGEITDFVEQSDLRTALPYMRVRIEMDRSHRLAVGDRVQSYRRGLSLEGVGQVMRPTSVLSVIRVEEAGVVAVVMDAFDRVRRGDMVRPAPPYDIEPSDVPDVVTAGGTAVVIGYGEIHAVQNMGDIAFLNRGESHGVKVGDEYVLVVGASEGWSGEVAGRLQVVGTRATNASARIVAVEAPDFVTGVTVHLDRKMR